MSRSDEQHLSYLIVTYYFSEACSPQIGTELRWQTRYVVADTVLAGGWQWLIWVLEEYHPAAAAEQHQGLLATSTWRRRSTSEDCNFPTTM